MPLEPERRKRLFNIRLGLGLLFMQIVAYNVLHDQLRTAPTRLLYLLSALFEFGGLMGIFILIGGAWERRK